jgi:hypothetical protein
MKRQRLESMAMSPKIHSDNFIGQKNYASFPASQALLPHYCSTVSETAEDETSLHLMRDYTEWLKTRVDIW